MIHKTSGGIKIAEGTTHDRVQPWEYIKNSLS